MLNISKIKLQGIQTLVCDKITLDMGILSQIIRIGIQIYLYNVYTHTQNCKICMHKIAIRKKISWPQM